MLRPIYSQRVRLKSSCVLLHASRTAVANVSFGLIETKKFSFRQSFLHFKTFVFWMKTQGFIVSFTDMKHHSQNVKSALPTKPIIVFIGVYNCELLTNSSNREIHIQNIPVL